MHEPCDRRAVLAAAAGVLPATALSGCLSDVVPGTGGGGGRPDYAKWVPADTVDDEEGTLFVRLDTGELEDLEDGDVGALPESATVDPQQDDLGDVDPLGAMPMLGLFVLALSAGFGLRSYGFGTNPLSGFGGGATPTGTSTSADPLAESVLLVDGVFVFRGGFTADAVTGEMDGFAAAGERDGYTVYEGTGDDAHGTGRLAFAVRDGTLVVPSATANVELRPRLDTVLDVRHGDATSLLEAEADVDWLVRTAGAGQVVIGAWETSYDGEEADTTEDPLDELGRPRGVVAGLTLGADATTGAFAAVFPEGETPDLATVREHVGTSADSRSVSVDGSRVSVEGTWEADVG